MTDISDEIIKKFGSVFQDADVLKTEKRSTVSTTPKIDVILGGGVPEGSTVVLSGKPGLGKSSLALQIAANAQNTPCDLLEKNQKRKVFYFDIEGRIKGRDIFDNNLLDTDPDAFKLIRSSKGNIIYGNQFLSICEKLMHAYPGSVFILDSVSSLCSDGKMKDDLDKRSRDDGPALLAAFCKRNNQVIGVNRSIVIMITHVIANQGMGMAQWVESGGVKIQYQADIKLMGRYFTEWKDKDNTRIGQEVYWECLKSALGPPGGTTGAWLRYGKGYDRLIETIELAIDVGIVLKKGSWFSYENIKVQGMDKLATKIEEDEKILQKLTKDVEDMYFGSS